MIDPQDGGRTRDLFAAPDPEEQARLDRVASAEQTRLAANAKLAAKRAADAERQRRKRAKDKEEKEADLIMERAKESRAEQVFEFRRAAAEQEHQRRLRAQHIISELSELPRPDTVDEDGNSYWATCVQPEIEEFVDEHQRASGGSWESFLFELSASKAGRRVLEFYGVQPLDIPLGGRVSSDSPYFLTLVQQASGPPIPVFTNLSEAERAAIAGLHEVWLANREAKKDWRP